MGDIPSISTPPSSRRPSVDAEKYLHEFRNVIMDFQLGAIASHQPHLILTLNQVIVSLTNLQKSLAHVQNGVHEMLYAYIKHTTSMLAGEPAALESLNISDLSATIKSALEGNAPTPNVFNLAELNATPVAVTSTPAAPATENGPKRKRKREKKERDPNAPKRPLTAAFLYSSHARPIVRKELEDELQAGQKLEPNAVNAEVTKRWNAMPEEDKDLWKQSYRDSMEKYKEEMKTYLAEKGVTGAVHLDDEEGSDEAEAGAADTDAEGSDSDDEHAAPAKVPTPPANTKTPRTNKRQKTAAVTNGTHLVPIAPQIAPSAAPVPVPQAKSTASILPPGSAPAEPTPAKKGGRKDKKDNKKGAAAATASPAAKETSPEDTKKTTTKKSSRLARTAEPEVETPAETKDTKKKRERKRKSEGTTA